MKSMDCEYIVKISRDVANQMMDIIKEKLVKFHIQEEPTENIYLFISVAAYISASSIWVTNTYINSLGIKDTNEEKLKLWLKELMEGYLNNFHSLSYKNDEMIN